MPAPLTARQAEILGIIQEYYAAHGIPPTVRHLGEIAGIKSINGVCGHIKALVAKGRLRPVLSGPKRHTKYVPVETRSPVLAALERLWEAVRARGHAERDASELREAMSEAKAVIEVARKQKGSVT